MTSTPTILTDKERAALDAIVAQGLQAMGGITPLDLLDDNMSWFDRADISRDLGINKNEAAGIMSALAAKGIAYEYDPGDWVLSDRGIKLAIDAIHLDSPYLK